jgi:putative transposase
MVRRARGTVGGFIYHAMNRGVSRMELFESTTDYHAFLAIIREVQDKCPVDLFSYCIMPNHWHMVLRTAEDGDLAAFMQRLTTTHARRWRMNRHSVGVGYVYQGRYRSFPMRSGVHFLKVCRYVERNALRANLCRSSENWRWGSLWQRENRPNHVELPLLCNWPVSMPRDWIRKVNRPENKEELEALRVCAQRGRPFGDADWVQSTIEKLGLEHTFRHRGRPFKKSKKKGTG